LANPAPVAQTFFVDEGVRAKAKLDAIVTVADAKNLPARLADSAEASAQIAFADIVILNKLDLVSPDEADAVAARIRAINPLARIVRATRADVPVETLLHQNAFDLARILDLQPEFLDSNEHGHTEGVYSASFEVARPIDMQKFQQWIGTLLQEKGGDLLRTKGILHVSDDPRRFAFQAVHMMADGDFLPTQAAADEKSRLVFIGRDLNRPQLRRGFEACQVAA
jgi:G3E family GTPase